MAEDNADQRLSQIPTLWSVVLQAHAEQNEAALEARKMLLDRYYGAVQRYLLAAVRDDDVAGELAQEFALRFIRGDFHKAHPEHGRFRRYLKTALIHLVHDHHRARQQWPRPLDSAAEPAMSPLPTADEEQAFLSSWRHELLRRAWERLARDYPSYDAVLRLRVEQPALESARIAETVSAHLGRQVNAAWVRKTLQRAHEKFASLLVEEVAASLQDARPETLRQELAEVDLLKYCHSFLEPPAQARSTADGAEASEDVEP